MSSSTILSTFAAPAAALMPLVVLAGCGGSNDSPTIGIVVDGQRVEAEVDDGELCYELDGRRECLEATNLESSPAPTLLDGRPASVLLDDDGTPWAVPLCDLEPDSRLVEVDC